MLSQWYLPVGLIEYSEFDRAKKAGHAGVDVRGVTADCVLSIAVLWHESATFKKSTGACTYDSNRANEQDNIPQRLIQLWRSFYQSFLDAQ